MTTRALSPSEIHLISQVIESRRRHRARLFRLLAVTTGFRVSELLTLRFSQLLAPTSQVATKEITVARRSMKGGHDPHTKAVRSRCVPLNQTARGGVDLPCDAAHSANWGHLRFLIPQEGQPPDLPRPSPLPHENPSPRGRTGCLAGVCVHSLPR